MVTVKGIFLCLSVFKLRLKYLVALVSLPHGLEFLFPYNTQNQYVGSSFLWFDCDHLYFTFLFAVLNGFLLLASFLI